jgi:hypothetical protein
LAKIAKRGVSVFPLEVYGFLVGTSEMVYVALAVGRNSKWQEAAAARRQPFGKFSPLVEPANRLMSFDGDFDF